MYYWLSYYICPTFSPFAPFHQVLPFPPATPSLCSCPWVMHVSSLASPFPILFLTSLCLFCIYHLYFLLPAPFPSFFPFPFPDDNPPNDLHAYDSVSVLVVCLVCFCFVLDSVVDSCEFVAFLMFIVLIFFFLNKSLKVVSNLLASLYHIGRWWIVLGHTLNTLWHVITHTKNSMF